MSSVTRPRKLVVVPAVCALLLAATAARAAPTAEWASSVIDFSSQFGSGNWSAAQALGAPDTPNYGDFVTAWAAAGPDTPGEFLTLGFATPTYSTGAVVRETYNNGFVTQIDALDSGGVLHTVWSGVDDSLANVPADLVASWSATSFLTTGLKIHVDSSHVLNNWEEIDAVQLVGDTTAPVPEPSTFALTAAGVLMIGWGLRSGRVSRRG
ncbi:MAG: hypothetical protein GC151_16495 [Betaproteobacteria bacterium]|nr:hypothetical protein [Betaproteobacteria bacterium]